METRCNVAVREQAGGHPGDPVAGGAQAVVAPGWGTAALESELGVSGLRLQQAEVVELDWLLLVTAGEEGH